MKGKMKLVWILVIIMLSGGALSFFLNNGTETKNGEAVKTTRAYLFAVATLDKEKAQSLSIGYAMDNLENMAAGDVKDVSVEAVDCEVLIGSSKSQELLARTEVWKGNQAFVDYYRVKLLNQGGGWKVYSVTEDRPSNLRGSSAKKSEDYWVGLIREYMSSVEKSQWEVALRSVVGPAMKGQSKTMGLLNGVQFKTPEDLKAETVFESERHVKVVIRYSSDGKSGAVIAEFDKTREGWKIYDITPL